RGGTSISIPGGDSRKWTHSRRGGTSISIPGGDSRKWTRSRPKRRKYQNFQNFNIKIFFSTILLNIKCNFYFLHSSVKN
ncbi:unnamed protein product, partial [Rotaria sp. Silwood1]